MSVPNAVMSSYWRAALYMLSVFIAIVAAAQVDDRTRDQSIAVKIVRYATKADVHALSQDALLHPAVGDTVTEDQRSPGVAERTKGPQTYRYSISAEATERELRLCGFALLNHYLSMHHVIAEHVRLQPVELLILVATTTGT